MDWKLIGVILGVLFAASWGVIIPVCISLWNSILKVKEDYIEFMADNVLTDAERLHLADDVILVIKDASNIVQFIINLITAIGAVIPKAVGKRARKAIKADAFQPVTTVTAVTATPPFDTTTKEGHTSTGSR